MLDRRCGIDDWTIILVKKGIISRKLEKKSFFGNISSTNLYCMVSVSR